MLYKPGDTVILSKDKWVIHSTVMGLRVNKGTSCTVLGFDQAVVGSPPALILEVPLSNTAYAVITVSNEDIEPPKVQNGNIENKKT